jgi:hypothetical protein
MTRDELLDAIEGYAHGVITAVDAYSAALLQQTPCSALRAALVKKQIELQNLEKKGFENYKDYDRNRELLLAIRHVLKLISDTPPIA